MAEPSIRLVSDSQDRQPFSLSDNGRRIFLDRYALKDSDRSLDKLHRNRLLVITPDPAKAEREIALVNRTFVDPQKGDMVEVRLESDSSVVMSFRIDEVDVPIETDPEQMHERVATAVASVEDTEEQRDYWRGQFFSRLSNYEIVPGGRVYASAGAGVETTCYNCYVLPPPHDSRNMYKYKWKGVDISEWALQDGIDETLSRMTEIFSRGGGVGIPINTLRPRDAFVAGVNGRSSGSVSWAEEYSRRTGKIEQGGSRRGALMIIQSIWHPDILHFITAKQDMDFATNCNMSVAVTDAFMEAVEADQDWQLIFPDTSFENYDQEWDGDITEWQSKGYPVKVYETIPARELWQSIYTSAHASAEPGLFFVDRYNKLSNSWYYTSGRIYCTNPCGEQGIPGNAVCNLLHLYLARFMGDPELVYKADLGEGAQFECRGVDLPALIRATNDAMRFGDNVIEHTHYFDPRNENQQKSERRVGLGTLGLAELLMRLKVEYGSDESLEMIDAIYGTIACAAYASSANLAEERGAFPLFDAEKFLESGFMKAMPEAVRDNILEKGARFVAAMSQAPTGTTGSMLGTSTSLEAYPWLVWTRTSSLGKFVEMAAPFREWWEANKGDPNDLLGKDLDAYLDGMWADGSLPHHFMTASRLVPEGHAKVQAAIQRWTDASISKTANLPEHYTPEQVGEYYQLIYSLGCKGGTVYRDGSRDAQPLESIKAEPDLVDSPNLMPIPGDVGRSVWATTETPVGKVTTFARIHPESKKPFDMFQLLGKTGTDVMADQEAIGRMMSLFLRINSPIDPMDRMEMISEALHGIGGASSVGFGEHKVVSIADGVAHNIDKLLSELRHKPFNGNGNGNARKDLCPSCGAATLEKGAGCETCVCGFSRC